MHCGANSEREKDKILKEKKKILKNSKLKPKLDSKNSKDSKKHNE
jgi:hypothetical protein